MKHLKKIVLGFVALVALTVLAACQQSSPNTAIITMKGHQITVTDFYNSTKTFPQFPATTVLQNLTFSFIFEKEYGKQVTDQDVTKRFNTMKSQAADSWSSDLQQQGLTETSYRQTLRIQMLQQKAVDANITKTQFTEANLKTAWSTYHPEVDAYIVGSSTEADAKSAHDLATSNADQFKSQAKDKNLEVKFDSSNTSIPADVQTAAFKLQNGQVSDVIPVQNSQTGATVYYVVYMITNPGKGTDMNKYKSQLENAIKIQKENDQAFVASVMKTYLTKYNVTVKEQAFSNIFSNYTGTTN